MIVCGLLCRKLYVKGEEREIVRAIRQQWWEIDHIEGRDAGWEFNLEGDPSSATSIDACYEHRDSPQNGLRKQSILNFSDFYRTRAVLIIIRHVIDSSANGI